jgi:ring-1,2-phenylacetyl-CoA epoxidase subunit PaaC
MFLSDATDAAMVAAGIAPDPGDLRDEYDTLVARVMAEATLTIPDGAYTHKGGRTGYMHTEHLGHILTSMQWLQRAYPGAEW